MAAILGPATALGAIAYLDSLAEKDRLPTNVVSPLKMALSKVLQKTEGDDWGDTDLTSIDVADTMWRFKHLTPNDYKEGSYRMYELRLRRAIEWYLKFRRNPGWFPPQPSAKPVAVKQSAEGHTVQQARPVPGVTDVPADAGAASAAVPTRDIPVTTAQPSAGATEAATERVVYPFPLEGGKFAQLHLPPDITRADVVRLKAFMDMLVIRKEDYEAPA